jgi:hypothetical protein
MGLPIGGVLVAKRLALSTVWQSSPLVANNRSVTIARAAASPLCNCPGQETTPQNRFAGA